MSSLRKTAPTTRPGGQDRGFVDRQGNRTPPWLPFASAREFSEGLAAVSAKVVDGPWDYIDADGKVRIPGVKFRDAGPFQDGLATVQLMDQETGQTLYGYIDKKGKTIWPPQA